MKLRSIKANCTEITLNDGTAVLFSYQTPVAALWHNQWWRTAVTYSRTTTRHINAWLPRSVDATPVPQSWFENLVNSQED